MRCSTQAVADSFMLWLKRHSTSLSSLQECSVSRFYSRVDGRLFSVQPELVMQRLPFPQLRQLHLQGLTVYADPASGPPGVLFSDCTALTALDLQYCDVQDVHAASAAISALPQLRWLRFVRCTSNKRSLSFLELQQPQHLTHLSCDSVQGLEQVEKLHQLSAVVNLKHLNLAFSSASTTFLGLPGRLLSQLTQLTCLQVQHSMGDDLNAAEQFQHLSSLTALQELDVACGCVTRRSLASEFSGIQHLSQLTRLKLHTPDLDFSCSCCH
jgi:hypothetical protein